MKHTDTVKRLFILQMSFIGLIIHTLIYTYFWLTQYYPFLRLQRNFKFYFRGHLLIIGIYFVLLFFFASTYGALKVGYLKATDVFISEVFSLLFVNVISYFQLSLMANWLILASPFMLVTAIAIKLYDRGPVFYKQVRCTIGQKKFYILKFRSMKVDAEKDGVARLASKNDSRITPVGKFIRATRIDELPQLINILKGEMSFIGPRPERPEIIEQYMEEMPEFAFRTKVKAGLAGYAQVYGKYNTTPYDKLKLDLTYIEQYTVWLDLKLMLLTLKILIRPESTEGVDSTQTTALKKEKKGHE